MLLNKIYLSQDHLYFNEVVERQNAFFASFDLKDQLYLTYCGSPSNITCYHAVLNSTVWNFRHMYEAVDFSFKYFLTQRLPYAAGCQHVWHFIQIFIYKMDEINTPIARDAAQKLWDMLEPISVEVFPQIQ